MRVEEEHDTMCSVRTLSSLIIISINNIAVLLKTGINLRCFFSFFFIKLIFFYLIKETDNISCSFMTLLTESRMCGVRICTNEKSSRKSYQNQEQYVQTRQCVCYCTYFFVWYPS